MTAPTYGTVNVDGLDVFYREAGSPRAPTVLLLHGFLSGPLRQTQEEEFAMNIRIALLFTGILIATSSGVARAAL